MTSNHRMRQASEGNGSRVAAGSVNANLRQIAEYSHVAYCSGPFQLAILLSALDVCGVPRANCTVMPFQGSARNDDLKKTLVEACARLGMQTVDAASIPSPTLSDARRQYDPTNAKHKLVHWYCQGVPFCRNALHHLLKTLPDIVFEYYDGIGAYIAASEQERKRLSLSAALALGDLRQLAVQRIMQPNLHFMPDDRLWQLYAPKQCHASTRYLSPSVMLRNVMLVGETLDCVSGVCWNVRESPDIIVLPSRFSEHSRQLGTSSLKDKELGLHARLLATVRSACPTAQIMVKTHPRIDTKTVNRLQQICADRDACLYDRQQLLEYMLAMSGRRDVVVIGVPGTSLLHTLQFGWGRSACLSIPFFDSHLGHQDAYRTALPAVDLLREAGVPVIDSLTELSDFLRQQ